MKKKYFYSGMISLFCHSGANLLLVRTQILLFFFVFLLPLSGVASPLQEVRITIQQKNVPLSKVFKEIEEKTDCSFLIRNNDVNTNEKVSIDAKNKTVAEILGILFDGKGIKYEVNGKCISVYKAVRQHTIGGKRKVTGHVMDDAKEPVIGASIFIMGTSNGVITDVDGNFSLELPNNNVRLQVSYIGYKTQIVDVGNKSSINIVLLEDSKTLEEVVVVGYGTQKKVNLTGAVSSVKMDDVLGSRPVTSALSALEGAIPGLQINKNSGKPGADINMNIRGVTSINGGGPLVLVDNVPMDLNLVNPNDIETVSVLKDAAASAIYGARAAFGVILVTTKQGKKDSPIVVNYSNNFSFSKVASKPEMITPRELLNYFGSIGMENSHAGQNIQQWKNYLDEYENQGMHKDGYVWGEDGYRYDLAETNAYDDMLDNAGFQQQHNIAVQGGGNRASYRISFGMVDEDGILITNKDSYRRYNLSSFVSMDATKWLTAQLDVKYANSRNTTAIGNSPAGNLWYFASGGLLSMSPLGIGTPTKNSVEEYHFATPRYLIESSEPRLNRARNMRALGRFILKPLKGWNITGEYTHIVNSASARNINKTFSVLYPVRMVVEEVNPENSYNMTNTSEENNVINIFSDYSFKLADHNITVMSGFNQELYKYEMLYGQRKELVNQDLPSLGQGIGEMKADDAFSELALRSFYYRVNYSYKDRYLFEANGRYDGSSRFPKKDRFGFFPSFSAAWRLSEEAFMEHMKGLFYNIKLRASWGNIGNQAVGSYYPYLSTIDINRPQWILPGGSMWVTSLTAPGLVSSSFTWEKVSTLNFGLDFNLWGKLDFVGNYYIRDTKDMLAMSTPLPSVLGVSAPNTNSASLRTQGWDITLEWKDKINKDFNYYVGLNLYDSKSKITKYRNPTGLLTSGNSLALREGMRYGEIWGYETLRFLTVNDFNADGTVKDGIILMKGQVAAYPGDILYVNQNGDNEISNGDNTYDNPGDMKIIGNRTPRYQYNITGGFKYKDVDFSFILNGIGKRDLWLDFFPVRGEFAGGVQSYMLDRWTPETPNAFYPRVSAQLNTEQNFNRQSKYLSDGSFLRLKNVTIGYSIPTSILQKALIQRARLFVSLENLLTLHHLPKGYMPDAYDTSVGGLGMNSVAGGDSYSGNVTYPLMRQFSFGLNLTF